MVDPVAFTAYATPAALVLVAVINGFSARQVAQVKEVVTKVEEQTNSRLTALLKKVEELESTIAMNANRRTDDKIDKLAQDMKDAKR